LASDKLPFRASKAFDILAAAPLVGWYGFSVGAIAMRSWRALANFPAGADAQVAIGIASELTSGVFLGVQLVLFLLRRAPLAKAPGFLPRLAGFVGAGLIFLLLALPRVTLSPNLSVLSLGIVMIATLAGVASAATLGRAFSVLPQARVFVTRGPYKYIRHPLYLAEQIGNGALAMQFKQPWAAMIVLASFAAQFPRMHYEERILRATFPEYDAYAERTSRLIPYVY
jgi:protein-S-isoprenylcysteine O-methyltransferase Ste14